MNSRTRGDSLSSMSSRIRGVSRSNRIRGVSRRSSNRILGVSSSLLPSPNLSQSRSRQHRYMNSRSQLSRQTSLSPMSRQQLSRQMSLYRIHPHRRQQQHLHRRQFQQTVFLQMQRYLQAMTLLNIHQFMYPSRRDIR